MSKKVFTVVFIVFVAGVLVSVPLRAAELLYAIEPDTGFYKTTGGIVTAINITLIAATVLMLVPLLFRNTGPARNVLNKSLAGAVISFAVAVCFCLAGVGNFLLIFSKSSAGTFLISITELLSAVFFLLLGLRRMGAKIDLVYAALLPVLWGIVILIVSFMKYTTIASISGYLFDVLKMVFVLAFVYYNALAAGNMPAKKGLGGLVAFGFPAALYCVLTTVPEYIAHAVNRDYGSLPDLTGILYLSLALYIVFTLVKAALAKTGGADGTSAAREEN